MTESALIAESMRNRHADLLHDAAAGRRDREFRRTARAARAAASAGAPSRWRRWRRPVPVPAGPLPAVPVPAGLLLATPVLAAPAPAEVSPAPSALVVQRWEGISPRQYDELRETVGWDRDLPAGMRFHAAAFGDDGGLRTTDVWDDEALFADYQSTRVIPGLERLGITARPDVAVSPVYELAGSA
jgi:hypothetical protein